MLDITFKTARFNLSVVGADFINECCFGEDLSEWLVASLNKSGIKADVNCMEDFGWANSVLHEGVSYSLCVAGNSDEDKSRPNYGQWHVMLTRHRSFIDALFGKNKLTAEDPVVIKIVQILKSAGFEDVATAMH
jgi:hypothetical protein